MGSDNGSAFKPILKRERSISLNDVVNEDGRNGEMHENKKTKKHIVQVANDAEKTVEDQWNHSIYVVVVDLIDRKSVV
jgi:hypothetical protein